MKVIKQYMILTLRGRKTYVLTRIEVSRYVCLGVNSCCCKTACHNRTSL